MNPQDNTSHDEDAYLLPTNKIKAVLQPLSSQDKPILTDAALADKDNPSSHVKSSTASKKTPKKTSRKKPAGKARLSTTKVNSDDDESTDLINTDINTASNNSDLAANVIRNKINDLYAIEPSAKAELNEARQATSPRSKHQQYMYELSTSGKPLAEIQTAWHEYYISLPDEEKHAVWNEFYAAHEAQKKAQLVSSQTSTAGANSSTQTSSVAEKSAQKFTDPRTVIEIKDQLLGKVRTRAQKKSKKPVHSLFFGLAVGFATLSTLLFGLFNERFIAPFITPSRIVSSTPIIIDPNSTAVDPEPKVIIPKINVEIPVVYDAPSINEKDIQNALERGVVHYATSSKPGELGNSVIVGHSSNNILNKGRYKFAFVLLSRLEPGDIFYLTKDSKRYAYKVYEKKIVKPTDISVLGKADRPATASLITCDPPGTTINRLVVLGEQISPDPAVNTASSAKKGTDSASIVPGNAPSLWQRLTGWLSS